MYSDRADVWGCKKPEPDVDVCPASVSSEETSMRIVEDYLELLKPFVQQIDRLNTRVKELEGEMVDLTKHHEILHKRIWELEDKLQKEKESKDG